MVLFQLVVTIFSLRIRSATSAASLLRAATSPARLAMLSPSNATGIRMAMKTSAASTSARVKPEWLLVGASANFIAQVVARLAEPYRVSRSPAQMEQVWTAFIDGSVGQKTDLGQI